MPGDERSPRLAEDLTAESEILESLAEGELEILGLLPRSSNYTFLARVAGGDTLAVYKPRRGEAPLWDFPDGTLCQREVAAYALARELGWPDVPPTVMRDGPEGPGSVQLFVEFDPNHHYFTMVGSRPDDFRRIALFDVVVNNADRKSGHCLLAADGHVFTVDHGVCFHEAPKLRTVIWDFQGEAIPDPLADDLAGLAVALAGEALCEKLTPLVSEREIDAVRHRLDALLSTRRFPEPGQGRPYPWPVV